MPLLVSGKRYVANPLYFVLKPGRRQRARIMSRPFVRRYRPSFNKFKGLILAQNERWRRGLGMQVERKGPAHKLH